MSYNVNIVSVEQKTSKKGNTFSLVRLLTAKGQTKDFFTSADEMTTLGYKGAMLSDLAKGKLIPVEVEIDPFGENPKITLYKGAS